MYMYMYMSIYIYIYIYVYIHIYIYIYIYFILVLSQLQALSAQLHVALQLHVARVLIFNQHADVGEMTVSCDPGIFPKISVENKNYVLFVNKQLARNTHTRKYTHTIDFFLNK